MLAQNKNNGKPTLEQVIAALSVMQTAIQDDRAQREAAARQDAEQRAALARQIAEQGARIEALSASIAIIRQEQGGALAEVHHAVRAMGDAQVASLAAAERTAASAAQAQIEAVTALHAGIGEQTAVMQSIVVELQTSSQATAQAAVASGQVQQAVVDLQAANKELADRVSRYDPAQLIKLSVSIEALLREKANKIASLVNGFEGALLAVADKAIADIVDPIMTEAVRSTRDGLAEVYRQFDDLLSTMTNEFADSKQQVKVFAANVQGAAVRLQAATDAAEARTQEVRQMASAVATAVDTSIKSSVKTLTDAADANRELNKQVAGAIVSVRKEMVKDLKDHGAEQLQAISSSLAEIAADVRDPLVNNINTMAKAWTALHTSLSGLQNAIESTAADRGATADNARMIAEASGDVVEALADFKRFLQTGAA